MSRLLTILFLGLTTIIMQAKTDKEQIEALYREMYEAMTAKDIAASHNKSAYQVILRWHLQCGTIAIPGSSNAAHIAEDYDIFGFELTPDEMLRINALECNHRFASY